MPNALRLNRIVLLSMLCAYSTTVSFAQEEGSGRHYAPPILLGSLNQEVFLMFKIEAFDLTNDGIADIVYSLQGEDIEAPMQLQIWCSDNQGSLAPCTEELIVGEIPITPRGYRQIIPADFNNDGWLDLFLESHGSEPDCGPGLSDCWEGGVNSLLLSDGNGKLVNVTASHMPAFSDFTHGSSVLDFDGDGDLDIWVNNLGGDYNPEYSYLLENDGNGVFRMVANLGLEFRGHILFRNGILPNGDLQTGLWSVAIDADGDGDTDLDLGRTQFWPPDEDWIFRQSLLVNDGLGHFELLPGDAWPWPDWAPIPWVQHALVYDLNNDGLDDQLLQSWNDAQPSLTGIQMLISNGDGTFRDESEQRNPDGLHEWITEFQLHDLDGDGHLDLFSHVFDDNETVRYNEILVNDGAGNFRRLSEDWMTASWNHVVLDVDGDGGTDFFSWAPNGIVLHKMILPYGPELDGTDEDDRLIGGAHDNIFRGLEGNDTLDGGLGTDQLDGGPGNDLLVGGVDDDVYILRASDLSGNDVIEDKQGTDTLLFDDFGLEAVSSAEQGPNGELILHFTAGGGMMVKDHFSNSGYGIERLSESGNDHPISNNPLFTIGTIEDLISLQSLPMAPALISPQDYALGLSALVELTWSAPEAGLTSTIEVATDRPFSDIVQEVDGTSATIITTDLLNYATEYFWRVRFVNATGPGAWSEIRSFTVGVGTAIDGEEEQPSEFTLSQNYPNPFNISTRIRFDLPHSEQVRLAVFNVIGQEVEILIDGQLGAASHEISWDASGLPPGLYFYRFTAGLFTKTKAMILL